MTLKAFDFEMGFSSESPRTIAIVGTTFYMIADVTLLGLLISSCLIRRPRREPKAVAFESLFLSIMSNIVSISTTLSQWLPYTWLVSNDATIFQTSVALVFQDLGYILIANVSYRLIYAHKVRHGDATVYSSYLSKMHGGFLATLISVCFVSIILWIIMWSGWEVGTAYVYVFLTGNILRLITSLEIMIEIILVVWKPKDLRLLSKAAAVSLTAVGTFLLVLNLFFCAFNIEDLIVNTDEYPGKRAFYEQLPPNTFPQIRPAVTAICMIGLYTGVIYCCMQWHKLDFRHLQKPTSTEDERQYMFTPYEEPHET